jgi:phosphopantothenoylcysteine decarboxylase/phosphopantothenate--cysteine ligase
MVPANSNDAIRSRVALGVCGGIAAYKAVEVLRGFQRAGCDVRVAMTKRACEFIQPLTFRALSGAHVIVDDYAPDNPDPIAHITFSQSVDLLVVVPATANILAKFANGVADDFLTSTYLACSSQVLVAPAMNPTMWAHPATQRNLEQLRSDGVIVSTGSRRMAVEHGPGRLRSGIVSAGLEILRRKNSPQKSDLSAEHFLITAGGTREEIDPVRFISNRSSGRMGFAVGEAARNRGAEVTLIVGSTTAPTPDGVRIIKVSSADEMAGAVLNELDKATAFVGAAAVADYKPVHRAAEKIKKTHDTLELASERTTDIRLKFRE